jgi:hypothetical protein
LRYESVPEMTRGDVESALVRNDPEELLVVSLSVALHSGDVDWAESVCLQLATHQHANVRGNAVLALGHLARLHGRLTLAALPVVDAALQDSEPYVRGQANAAADDLEHFLGWRHAR